jgi:molybdopterin molybdotransferase
MLSYEDALARIVAGVSPLAIESRPLLECLGAVLASPVTSPIDLPRWDNSSMDGYAVRAADTRGAGADSPVVLPVAMEVPAGRSPESSLPVGQAARIFTGAMIPEGADAIVPVEDTRAPGDGWVGIILQAEPGQYIRRAGADMRAGVEALTAGAVIRPYEIAQAAAVGAATLRVFEKPRVAIIASGNELVEPGTSTLDPASIYNSNAYAVSAQVIAAGAEVAGRFHAVDSRESLRVQLRAAVESGADVIVTSGGVSVGDYDFVKAAVEDGGGGIDFWRVAIRPGKPFVFGSYEGKLFFGLPGNPVSTMVTFELFVRPALRRIAGHPPENCARPFRTTLLLDEATHEPSRRSFQRAWTEFDDEGRLTTRLSRAQESHMIRGLASSNSLLVVPEDVSTLSAHSNAKVMLLD